MESEKDFIETSELLDNLVAAAKLSGISRRERRKKIRKLHYTAAECIDELLPIEVELVASLERRLGYRKLARDLEQRFDKEVVSYIRSGCREILQHEPPFCESHEGYVLDSVSRGYLLAQDIPSKTLAHFDTQALLEFDCAGYDLQTPINLNRIDWGLVRGLFTTEQTTEQINLRIEYQNLRKKRLEQEDKKYFTEKQIAAQKLSALFSHIFSYRE